MNEDYNIYYDWKTCEIKFDVIKERIWKLVVKLGYSPELVKIIEKMLIVDEF